MHGVIKQFIDVNSKEGNILMLQELQQEIEKGILSAGDYCVEISYLKSAINN